MATFYRAFETEAGTWSCTKGVTPVDEHAILPDAIAHLLKLAEEETPAYVYVHWLDGRVESIGEADPTHD